jgi:hypothetical protein
MSTRERHVRNAPAHSHSRADRCEVADCRGSAGCPDTGVTRACRLVGSRTFRWDGLGRIATWIVVRPLKELGRVAMKPVTPRIVDLTELSIVMIRVEVVRT